MPALRAGGGSRPRPLGASLPPPAACGPLPLPTLGGLGAARPARLRRSGLCGGWSPPSAAQVAPLRGLPAASRCSGAPPRAARPSPLRGRAPRGLAPLLPLAGRGVGAPGRPAPTRGGFWGGAALRPGRARLRPAAPLRRPAAEPRGGVRALWARPVRGRNLDAARKGLARVAGRGPIPRRARLVQTYVAAEKLEQAGKKLGVDLSVETQGAMGIQNQFSPEQIDEADYIVIAADVAIDEASRFGNKKLYVTSLEDAIIHPEQILESLTTKSYSYQDATVSNKKILG